MGTNHKDINQIKIQGKVISIVKKPNSVIVTLCTSLNSEVAAETEKNTYSYPRILFFGEIMEKIKDLTEGTKICVSGNIQSSLDYEHKKGNNRPLISIFAESVKKPRPNFTNAGEPYIPFINSFKVAGKIVGFKPHENSNELDVLCIKNRRISIVPVYMSKTKESDALKNKIGLFASCKGSVSACVVKDTLTDEKRYKIKVNASSVEVF